MNERIRILKDKKLLCVALKKFIHKRGVQRCQLRKYISTVFLE